MDSTYTEYLSFYRGKKALVTGACGYLGGALSSALETMGCDLMRLDVCPRSQPTDGAGFVQGDVSVRETWERFLPNVDVVFHMAAEDYQKGAYDPFRNLGINAGSMLHLLEVSRHMSHAPRIIFASSSNVFGAAAKMPLNDTVPPEPVSTWSVHKWLAEEYLRTYVRTDKMAAISLRLANVYGPSEPSQTMSASVLNGVIAQALAGHAPVLYGNADCIRDYIFIADVVEAFLLAGAPRRELLNGDAYVLGTGSGKTFREVWQMIVGYARDRGSECGNVGLRDDVKTEALEQRHFVADSSRFETITGWKAQVDLAVGIVRTMEFLEESAYSGPCSPRRGA